MYKDSRDGNYQRNDSYIRIRGNMIEVYKILTDRYCKNVKLKLQLHQDNVTRGHNLKVIKSRIEMPAL